MAAFAQSPLKIELEGSPQVSIGDAVWVAVDDPRAEMLVSDYLDFPVELRPHTAFEKSEEGLVAPRYRRADIHVVTTASLLTLAGLLDDPAQADPRRFRPNIVIETEDELSGFAEHGLVGQVLEIGRSRLSITEPCARCAFTSISQGDLSFEPAVLHK